jgi:hypothetical protein
MAGSENGHDTGQPCPDIAIPGKPDEDIDVGRIMNSIRDSIRTSKKEMSDKDIEKLLYSLRKDCDVENKTYVISSHRKFIGSVLKKFRQLVHGEVRRYVDPAISKQNRYNANALLLLENLSGRIDGLSTQVAIINGQADVSGNWSDFYNKSIDEDFLQRNVEYHREFVSLIQEYAKNSSPGVIPKLMEVGLGTATLSIYFSRNAYFNVGIDKDPFIVKNAIHTNKKLGGYSKFILIDAFDLHMFKDQSFDVAYSQGTMEHFDNREIIDLISKQLSLARFVIFSVPSLYWPDKEFGNERKMTIEDWGLLLGGAGFTVLHLNYYKDNTQIACVVGRKDD